jgi:hypothetical protein
LGGTASFAPPSKYAINVPPFLANPFVANFGPFPPTWAFLFCLIF